MELVDNGIGDVIERERISRCWSFFDAANYFNIGKRIVLGRTL